MEIKFGDQESDCEQNMFTKFSSLILYHSFFHIYLKTLLLFSSLNFFTLFMDPTPVSGYSVFFLVPNSPKLILLKKKKKKLNSQPRKRKQKKKKKHKQPTPTQKKKKKSQKMVKSCGCGSPMCI